MNKRGSPFRDLGPLVLGCALLAAHPGASAEYFSLYLKCEGEVTSTAGKNRAPLDVALRDHNQSAVIQRSNILPVGEKMKYEVSPATYSMTYRSPKARTQLYYDWMRGQLFAWDPSLQRLAYIRLSIDARTAIWKATSQRRRHHPGALRHGLPEGRSLGAAGAEVLRAQSPDWV
jgi:hypothetical protein